MRSIVMGTSRVLSLQSHEGAKLFMHTSFCSEARCYSALVFKWECS